MINYQSLGKTGLKVSSLCMGTMTFGAEAEKNEASAMFNLCRDNGINFFDCANKYADGEAEKILGGCMQGCRDDVVIATKGASRISPEVNALGASRKHLMLELEKSLQRLKTDYIDLYYVHYFDPCTAIESTLRFLDDAVSQGKILYTGVSNWSAWQIMKSIHLSKINHLQPIDCIQPMYSLVKRQAEVELFPLATDQQLGVVPYSPVGAGVLTGKYHKLDSTASARLNDKDYYHKRYLQKCYFDIANAFLEFASENGYEAAPLAISWAMHHPAVTAPIIGARNKEQLKMNLKAVDIEMTADVYKHISALSISPPPAHDRLEEQLDPGSKLR